MWSIGRHYHWNTEAMYKQLETSESVIYSQCEDLRHLSKRPLLATMKSVKIECNISLRQSKE
jgi:hypothetical protein